jgi:hypothetical protein
MVAPWPLMSEHGTALSKDPIAVAQFTNLQGLVRAVNSRRLSPPPPHPPLPPRSPHKIDFPSPPHSPS